ncbi:MAG TPA: 2Fe-2S iron-sulfur cluster-binding protein, partial [Verrucomicrobiota bacterium]|nr:2Fe-2S iron-sulfur cluster-binding protein [Verrucomicrobiota bacterium]
MDKKIKIKIVPEGKILEVEQGTLLQEVLFQEGVEFPCGGKGICKTCRIKVIDGVWEPNAVEKKVIRKKDLEDGWRLACQGIAQNDLIIELQKVKDEILVDNRRIHFKPQEGIGVAVDLGTTTVVAQLIDLKTGDLLGTVSELNQQAQFGADIMSRITFALIPENKIIIQKVITEQIWKMIQSLIERTKRRFNELKRVVIAGNTVMHHLFCGLSVESLAFYPFETSTVDLQILEPAQLGWICEGRFKIYFLPCRFDNKALMCHQ